jgi:pectinesterase
VALHVEADQAVFRNCKFLGNQDTIYASGENSRQLFIGCFIEGTTDFIFGPATAVFQSCIIRCKSNSFITAASTPAWKPYGYVFKDCKILADSAVQKVFLGRPWRAHAKTVFIRCELPAVIAPAGWDHWGNTANQQTAFYAEYKNIGKGANPSQRASWTHQLTDEAQKHYELAEIFAPIQNNEKWYLSTTLMGFQWPVAGQNKK